MNETAPSRNTQKLIGSENLKASFNIVLIDPSCSDDARGSARRIVRSNAARVSAHLSAATKAENSKRRKAARITQIGITLSTSHGEQQQSPCEHDGKNLPIATTLHAVGHSLNVPAAMCEIFYLPCMPAVVNNYLSRLTMPIPEVDGPDDTHLMAKVWFPMVLHSPTIFQVVMLFSASHFANYFPDEMHLETLLFLKQNALSALSNLVCTRSTSDEAIGATVKMASFEALFGDPESYHIHMRAVERMLELRGGISKLGLNGFMARLLMFVDTNSAYILNTSTHLDGSMLPRREPLKFLNVIRFKGE